MKRIILLSLTCFLFLSKTKAQNHHFGIKMGYTKSSASIPDGNLFIGNSGVTQGQDWFKWTNGFQIGVLSNIDIGYDFIHLDFAPQYSRYGFENNKKVKLDYLDFDIGLSNTNSEVLSKLVAGLGLTPSLVLSFNNIEDINNFNLKAYIILGYRFYADYVIFTQLKYGLIELIPKSKIKNLQISLNINIPILKLKK